ncbi:YdeI/OmpD-associated family protein [Pseudonocardia sp. CA-107938]|uniref:YdeI/OmpD-associated family protein n=1 Tax=Pseudonocardia sp. CA-107938 TaxID=3240021 RepID=UPI003D938668
MREDAERIQPETIEQWRAWLAEHHARGSGVWLVTWKASAPGPTLGYEECVEQALCFGWVDSSARGLDEQRTMLWFAPRRPGSGWARTNKARIERLTAAGLMAPAGQAVIDAARADGSWTLLDDVEDLVVPPDLADALAAVPPARERFDAFPPSVRRAILAWIVTAKRPATRASRIATTAEKAARGERAQG